MKTNKLILIVLLPGLMLLQSCRNVEKEMAVSTGEPQNVLATTANVRGEIIDLGEGATQYGHCYSTSQNPTTALPTKTAKGIPEVGEYTSNLTNLNPSTKYYVKAYISRGNSVVYGEQKEFETASGSKPQLTTANIQSITITKTSAICGGEITNQGGTPVTERGVCLNETGNPTINDIKVQDDSTGTGKFTCSVSGLKAGTKYYVRAYAVNSGGTNYGNEVDFITASSSSTPPVVITSSISSVTATSAIGGGEVTSDGGTLVTLRGVTWNTVTLPVYNLHNKTENGSGTGVFVSNIGSLSPGTQYYVRAYAVNGAGSNHAANEISFITCRAPIATTNAAYYNATSATLYGQVNANSINDSVTKVTFEYGLTTSYGSTIAATPGSLTGSSNTPVSVVVTDLTPNTVYHFRVKAANCGGVTYGNDLTFTTDPSTVSDIDGNTYNLVRIGTQLWMKENLKTTKYKNNTTITKATSESMWCSSTDGLYGWYNGDISNKSIYGALYNFIAVSTGNLCPDGWKVPSDAEWNTLEIYLQNNGYNYDGTIDSDNDPSTNNKIAKAMADVTLWTSSTNTGAVGNTDFPAKRNVSGFSGRPGGRLFNRLTMGCSYEEIGSVGYWWTSSTGGDYNWPIAKELRYSTVGLGNINILDRGYSVRCIRNSK
jgi:uncharacterized protein (TIGR02145 family)